MNGTPASELAVRIARRCRIYFLRDGYCLSRDASVIAHAQRLRLSSDDGPSSYDVPIPGADGSVATVLRELAVQLDMSIQRDQALLAEARALLAGQGSAEHQPLTEETGREILAVLRELAGQKSEGE